MTNEIKNLQEALKRQARLSAVLKSTDPNVLKELEIKGYDTTVLENDIVIPSGRQDGKGTKITVRYLAGRNPI